MRISLISLLLLGTTLAAPVAEIDSGPKTSGPSGLIARGTLSVLPRAPIPVPAGPGAIHGKPPQHPNGHPKDPKAPKPPKKPKKPKRPEGPGCTRKRCESGGGTEEPGEGSKKPLPIEEAYRFNGGDEAKALDTQPGGEYLESIPGLRESANHWTSSTFRNSEEQTQRWKNEFENWVEELKEKKNPALGKSKIQQLKTEYSPGEIATKDIVVTYENAQAHTLVVKASYNQANDLYPEPRKADGTRKDDTHPEVGNAKDKYRWSDMVFKSWKTAADNAGDSVSVSSLRYITRDSIQTGTTKKVLKKVMKKVVDEDEDGDKEHTFTPGTDGFNQLSETVHVNRVKFMLDDYKDELGDKTIKSLTVFGYVDEGEWDEHGWHMIIELEGERKA